MAATRETCAACGKRGPVMRDETMLIDDELALDVRGLVAHGEYVCGACLDAAERVSDLNDALAAEARQRRLSPDDHLTARALPAPDSDGNTLVLAATGYGLEMPCRNADEALKLARRHWDAID